VSESLPATEVAPEPVDAARAQRSFGWASLVRGVAHVPASIRAKQLVGTIAVAALLALVAVLGLVALGQSNSRSTELRKLQQQAVYEQLLLTDATQLKEAIDTRLSRESAAYDNGSYTATWVLSGYDHTIAAVANRLCLNAGYHAITPGPPPMANACLFHVSGPHQPLTLRAVAPSLYAELGGFGGNAVDVNGYSMPLLWVISESGSPQRPIHHLFVRADKWARSFQQKLGVLTGKTEARTNALAASDRHSYTQARNLLIGAGAGSLLLALGLALLLSDSLLVPLRTTERRLAAIARGDFSGHVEVPNRDEIGTLAANVNRMSDELQRLYGELEKASRHKSDFLATTSHELRTPLNAIIGFSEVLHEQMFGELNERQRAYVEDVLEAGKHLLSLINDVLDLAKIEAGKMELERSQVSIPEVLQSAVALHAERASREGIDLSLTTEPEEITVDADGRRVRQIVFNLLSNAVRFTPAGGRVEISARLENREVEIAVADTGPGIAPDELETIFEEFGQARDGKQAEGTGLGLPLSRKLVELHGGRLWVESELGHGSAFRFTLPAAVEAALVPAAPGMGTGHRPG
jgi:signal transduction histidine kinase